MSGIHLTYAFERSSPRITVSMYSRARRASASIVSGFDGLGVSGSKMFSQTSGIVKPVRITGMSSL